MTDFRDHTAEFAAIAAAVAREMHVSDAGETPAATSSSSSSKEGDSALAARTRFTQAAAELGRDIHRTSEKLTRLANLAKTTSLFTEQSSGPEIQRLIGEVNRDLQRMTAGLDALQSDVQARSRGARSQDADHHRNVVSYLKAQVGETTAAFKDVLQTRTTNLKAQEEKKRSIRATHVPLLGAGERSASNPLYRGTAFYAEHEDSSSSGDGGSSDVAVQVPELAVAQQSSYYRLRADAVRQIEQSMVQLQGIYTQLAGMVQEQDELLDTIDHNIDDAVLHVDAAHGVLQKQLARVSKNRWLIMKILAVLFVTVIIFFFFFL